MASEDSDDGHPSGWKENPKILIIGAGIAGLTAARYLNSHGITNLDILEATDRLGGRIWSIDLDTVNGQKAELGANWIHGIDLNPIFKLSVENGLLKPNFQGRKLGQKLMFVNLEGDPVNAKVVEEVDLIYGLLMSQVEDFYQEHMPTPVENDSVGAFLEREFEEKMAQYHGPDKELRRWIFQQRMLNESIINGCNSMKEVSLSEAGCFEELPGVHYSIPQGFGEVVEVISKDIPKDRIHLDHPVTQITWSEEAVNPISKDKNHEVCVECSNGKRFYADHILVTISLGCLQQYSSRLFDPPLPEFKMDAINRMAIGCVNKIVLEFASGPVLPKGIRRMEMITNRDETQECDFVYSNEYLRDHWHKKISFFEAIQPNVLIGWLCGREAEFMEELSDNQVVQRCTQVLESALKKNIPAVKRIARSLWKSMPYSLGSYSFIPVGATTDDVEALSEPVCSMNDKPVLMFAGEATHPTFYSSSHGAYLTGEREAQRIINLYQH